MSDQPRIRVTITETIVYERSYTPEEIAEAAPGLGGLTPGEIVTVINDHGDSEGHLHEDMERHNEVTGAVAEAVLIHV
ncbi:hypothetical protein HCA61_22280 [Rhodococcus sp. HNM0563]|uniref:hypothetical protein n=1 Tax=Rhodococcus sp. HNM0563 TaxID=2716339 RepID=UPI00146CE3A6|nr:hypothetical protein [Rhodococcus sp. HNM0563]NLU64968.1 hypothetical protein [Rhodococcus sp. HNM0563]